MTDLPAHLPVHLERALAEKRRRARFAAGVVILLLLLAAVYLSWLAYLSASYTSYHQSQLVFHPSSIVVFVVLNFYSDGPISQGVSLTVRSIQFLGSGIPNVNRIFFRILLPGLQGSYPDFNQSLPAMTTNASWSYVFPFGGTAKFVEPGAYNVSGWTI